MAINNVVYVVFILRMRLNFVGRSDLVIETKLWDEETINFVKINFMA